MREGASVALHLRAPSQSGLVEGKDSAARSPGGEGWGEERKNQKKFECTVTVAAFEMIIIDSQLLRFKPCHGRLEGHGRSLFDRGLVGTV